MREVVKPAIQTRSVKVKKTVTTGWTGTCSSWRNRLGLVWIGSWVGLVRFGWVDSVVSGGQVCSVRVPITKCSSSVRVACVHGHACWPT